MSCSKPLHAMPFAASGPAEVKPGRGRSEQQVDDVGTHLALQLESHGPLVLN
jgi:hypothetical protein